MNLLAPLPTRCSAFVTSALAGDSAVMPLARFRAWFAAQHARCRIDLRRVPFTALAGWELGGAPLRLGHASGRFFSVEGLKVETDFGPVSQWFQPIVRQAEIGILGLIVRRIDGLLHVLMQVKNEPGNAAGAQLSPTVQATFSNYTQVHGGRLPPYMDYFLEPGRATVLIDVLLAEQGARFLGKRNRNMVVEVTGELPLEAGFCWLTLGQIKRLLRESHLVGMSARSVLSTIPLDGADDALADDRAACPYTRALARSWDDDAPAAHSQAKLDAWLAGLAARYTMAVAPVALDRLPGWQFSTSGIAHASGRHFTVVGVAAEANGREVARWSQPLLEHSGRGLNGFLVQRRAGVLHLLVRACMFPGNARPFELGSTVSRANAGALFDSCEAPLLLEQFRDPPPERVRYAAEQCEEGGRFRHFTSSYRVVELPDGEEPPASEAFRWMTMGQLARFNRAGLVNIEARNLISCLGFHP